MEQQSLLPSRDEAPGPSRAKLALASALATGCLFALATTVDPSGARPESSLAATGGEAEEGPSGGIGVSGPNGDYVLDIYGVCASVCGCVCLGVRARVVRCMQERDGGVRATCH